MKCILHTMSLMANYKGPSKFIQIKVPFKLKTVLKTVTVLKSQKTNINSVPSSVQMGQIIYERNMGWVVWKLTNTKSGLKVAWGFNFPGKRLFLSVNMFYRIWDKPAGSKKM